MLFRSKKERTCRFVDEYHTEVGNNLYHICEFAEVMQRSGNSYEAMQEKGRKQEQSEKTR